MTPAPLLLTALLALSLAVLAGQRLPRTWLVATLLGAASGLGAALVVLHDGAPWEWRSSVCLGGEAMHWRLDALSAVFLALPCVVGAAGAIYSTGYWSAREHPASAGRGRSCWSALILCLGIVLLASNGLHFLLGWELFTVCAYFLITLERGRRDVRAAGWLYLAASHVGTLCLFAFFSLLAARQGSWDLGPLRAQTELAPLFWLALVGFGVKAGAFPLHVWLPSAHANAPSHVSAILSAVAIKMGVYGLVRFTGWLPVPREAGWVVAGMGAAGAVLGSAFAVAQTDLKRLLAYCSVENVGILLIGLGGALVAREDGTGAWGHLLLAGALCHAWNHAAFKALLFLAAGSVLHATGTREMSRLGGLWRRMPRTASLFALASVAASGLPPLNGFVSEWLVLLGLFDATTGRGSASWAAGVAAVAIAMAGALALASFVKTAGLVFLGAPRTQASRDAQECGPWMRMPMVVLALACLGLGLAPVVVWPALSDAVAVWHPGWTRTPAPAALVRLGAMALTLLAAAGAATLALRRRSAANGTVRGPTWDCGFAAPTARMQYTAGSFGGIAVGWFAWILRPERRVRRPHGAFPSGALFLQRIPETVLERAVVPVGRGLLRISTAVRRLQHGRLQSYVAYVVVGLVALAALVAWETSR